MTDRELQTSGSAARAGRQDRATRDEAPSPASETPRPANSGPRMVRRPADGDRAAPAASPWRVDAPHREEALPRDRVDDRDTAPGGDHLARDLDPEDRVGPYLLFDDEADEAATALPEREHERPEPAGRPRRRTARALLAALRAAASEGVERLEGGALWWVALRPATFAPSAIAVAIGVLLAAGAGPFGAVEIGLSAAVVAGVLAAHAARNLLDHRMEIAADVAAGERAVPAAEGRRDTARLAAMRLGGARLLVGALIAYAVGAAALTLLVRVSGSAVAGFAAAGLALSLADVLPPLALKRRAAGAWAGAIAWGPVIVVGSAMAVRGEVPAAAWLASVPYALAMGAALLGARLQARATERERGDAGDDRTADARARDLVVKLAQLSLVWVGALVVAGAITPWALLVLLALPRFRRLAVAVAAAADAARPAPRGDAARRQSPAAAAMDLARATGALLALGLAVGLLVPH